MVDPAQWIPSAALPPMKIGPQLYIELTGIGYGQGKHQSRACSIRTVNHGIVC
jgi:hypothetical protein